MTIVKLIGLGAAALVTGVPVVVLAAHLHGPAAAMFAGSVLYKLTETAVGVVLRSEPQTEAA